MARRPRCPASRRAACAASAGNFRASEPAAGTSVADDGLAALVGQDGPFALLAAMLPLAEKDRVGDAQILRSRTARIVRHLPQSAARRGKRVRPGRRQRQQADRRNRCRRARSFGVKVRSSSRASPLLYAHDATFAISIGKLVAQNAQSTRIMPSSSAMSPAPPPGSA